MTHSTIILRGHPGLNRGQSDLQSDALPLSYAPLLYNRKDEKEKTYQATSDTSTPSYSLLVDFLNFCRHFLQIDSIKMKKLFGNEIDVVVVAADYRD